MSRSKVAAALALVVALSFAVPALAGSTSPIKFAKKALGLSKKADKRARSALKRANTANAKATAALAKAGAPVTEAAHAGNADHATNADKATTADEAARLDGFTVVPLIKAQAQPASSSGYTAHDSARDASPEIPIYSKGPLRIYAKCFGYNDGNPNVFAEVYIQTSQNGVVYDGSETDSHNGFLNTGEIEANRVLNVRDSADTPGTINTDEAADGPFFAFAPDGTALQGAFHLATKAGAPPAGDGVFGPNNCLISGTIAAS